MAKSGNAVVGINELAEKMAVETGWDVASCKTAISGLTTATLKLCREKQDVRLIGFATFSNEFVPAHEATNPQNPTGPKLQIADKHVFKAKAAKGIDMTPPAPAVPARRRR
jgi:nucleoid DNA-binding protein